MEANLRLGAVAYDPRVVDAWDRVAVGLRDAGVPTDTVFFPDYPSQVTALRAGSIDVAWNSDLAHVEAQGTTGNRCRGLVQRDTDVGRTTRLIALKGGSVASLDDLKGKTLALGARDCPHASHLPVHFLAAEGLREGQDYVAVHLDSDPGMHGRTGRSDVDVARAVLSGRADAGAVSDAFWDRVLAERRVPAGALAAVWSSPAFAGSVFDARPGLSDAVADRYARALLGMQWETAADRTLLEAVDARRWVAVQESGYDALRTALQRGPTVEPRAVTR